MVYIVVCWIVGSSSAIWYFYYPVALQDTSKSLLHFHNVHGYSYVSSARWSPVHPAVFTTTGVNGEFKLWNLNQDVDDAVATVKSGAPLYSSVWNKDGTQIAIMDQAGALRVYDVHESLFNVKPTEWNTLQK